MVKTLSQSPQASSTSTDRVSHEFDFAEKAGLGFSLQRTYGDGEKIVGQGAFSIQSVMLNALNGRFPEPLEADLSEVSVSLQIVDRYSPRVLQGRPDVVGGRWARALKVRLPVRCPYRWNEIAVKGSLEKYLFFNTGDDWELEFVERPEEDFESTTQIEGLEQERLWKQGIPQNLAVVLCSGGVDSTGGLAFQSSVDPEKQFLLVSVDTSCISNARQKDIIRALPIRERVHHLRLGYSVRMDKPGMGGGDRSTSKMLRTRALLFLTTAMLAARRVGQNRFYVYENGIGALNLAFDRSQVPGQANRAVHPASLAMFGEFATALFRESMTVENPFLFETKASMCPALDTLVWHRVIPLTFTCGHPQRVAGIGILHCGVCTSCLLRRQGFRAANMHLEDGAKYAFDPTVISEGGRLTEKSAEWLKFGTQFRGIRKAISHTPHEPYIATWKRLGNQFPELRALGARRDISFEGNLMSPNELQFKIVKMLSAYVQEGIEITPAILEKVSGGETTIYISDQHAA